MAKNKAPLLITDNLFQKVISCPLKLHHHTNQRAENRKPVSFRHRNKLLLRDAVALQHDHVRFTSDDTETAMKETNTWLHEPDVVICGAVIKSGNCITRIPALKKSDSNYTLIQIHGKLRKGNKPEMIHAPGASRTVDVYLLKAAYRMFVFSQKIKMENFSAEFVFPSKSFRASLDHLYQFVNKNGYQNAKARADFDKLFTSVTATGGVKQVLNRIPDRLCFELFVGKSIEESVAEIEQFISEDNVTDKVNIHSACKYCEYRTAHSENEKGCWSTFFPNSKISNPEKHVFELIGHGNQYHTDNGVIYQEQVPLPESVVDFSSIQKQSNKSVTIQHRRLLQILAARGLDVPQVWIKPGLKGLNRIEYPIHFLDFEAATYAIPSKRNSGPYDPVYFQFSCHTLHRDGQLHHTEWLDDNENTDYTNHAFAKVLIEIDDIFSGTIMQYSPFEKQAINNVIKELSLNSMLYENTLKKLKILRQSGNNSQSVRFLDLNKLIRDNYYNSYMQDKLGLKYVLNAILKWERKHSDKKSMKGNIYDLSVDFLDSKHPNPYDQIQNNQHLIEDGSEAMDAWISFKTGAMNSSEKKLIPIILKRYCALDSYAMFIIFNHLLAFTDFHQDRDIVLS